MGAVRLLHSLDSAPLAVAIAARAEGPTRVLVEVSLAGNRPKVVSCRPSFGRSWRMCRSTPTSWSAA